MLLRRLKSIKRKKKLRMKLLLRKLPRLRMLKLLTKVMKKQLPTEQMRM